ncbi:TIGR03862 family flavoprotein [Phaeovulum sp.]|uniref:TIGR03862 family flavoprotein n=1 Tax=Phaeovulum sp. TaxID=2934796 RepID=UPI0039E6CEB2
MDALVIGAGPAGLMAAEALARAGRRVTVAESRPTPARKFLMAGKSGLNLTKDEPLATFTAAYDSDWLAPLLANFGPEQTRDWATGLGVDLFTGSTGRVFPVAMKASPLLRAWLAQLAAMGVQLQTRWAWVGLDQGFVFDTPEGRQTLKPKVTVLALGGGSWPRLGSNAAWVPILGDAGVGIAPLRPANMGFSVDWSAHMAPHFGTAVKGCALLAGGRISRGEWVITPKGIEGGGVYAVSAAVRDGAPLTLDLAPDRSLTEVLGRLLRPQGRDTTTNWLRKALHLDPVKLALLQEWGRPLPKPPGPLAQRIKSLPVRHSGPRPLAEAISSAGGILRTSLTEDLELTALPGTFACGEMLDWEAPTGGYLLTGCLATGLHAGRAAARHF